MPQYAVRLRLALFALLAGALAGCGSKSSGVEVKGKVVVPKQVKLADTDSIIVTFLPEGDPKASGATATVNPKDMTFSTTVRPGKYKVAVTFQPYPGEKDSAKRAKELEPKVGAYTTESTPLRAEISSESPQTMTIDLAAGSISK
jgi:hypothetical protein